MKRTIEYCDELVNDKSRTYYEIVKQIQIDAIDATVKACAENANLIEFRITPQDVETIENGMGDIWGIDKQSILQVADKLKKELE